MPGLTMKRINGQVLCFDTIRVLARLSGAKYAGTLTTKQFQDIEKELQEKNKDLEKQAQNERIARKTSETK